MGNGNNFGLVRARFDMQQQYWQKMLGWVSGVGLVIFLAGTLFLTRNYSLVLSGDSLGLRVVNSAELSGATTITTATSTAPAKSTTTAIAKPSPSVSPTTPPFPTPTVAGTTTQQARVVRVIDGDTVELEGGEKVRYIGIDTPETHHPTKGVECYGQVAAQKNAELVLNKMIELEKDVSETDRYGRLLRYVYVEQAASEAAEVAPKIMVNEYLIQTGYAHASSYPPDIKYQENFRQLEAKTRTKMVGLWGACPL